MAESVMYNEIGVNATDADLIEQMRCMKKVREVGSFKHVVCGFRGFDTDPRELYEVPEVRAVCKRLVELGYISFLDFTTYFVGAPELAKAGWGAAEVILCGDNRLKAEIDTREPNFIEKLSERYVESNGRADALVGAYKAKGN